MSPVPHVTRTYATSIIARRQVLRSMRPVTLDDTVLGQYRSRTTGGKTLPGYLDDPTVPAVRTGEGHQLDALIWRTCLPIAEGMRFGSRPRACMFL
jgi:hypothetical protein